MSLATLPSSPLRPQTSHSMHQRCPSETCSSQPLREHRCHIIQSHSRHGFWDFTGCCLGPTWSVTPLGILNAGREFEVGDILVSSRIFCEFQDVCYLKNNIATLPISLGYIVFKQNVTNISHYCDFFKPFTVACNNKVTNREQIGVRLIAA